MTKKISDNLFFCYFVVFVSAAILYIATCAPGALWQDSGMIQYRAYNNDIEGGLGLALSHPLYYITAIAFKNLPFGEMAFKVNLISALAGAFAVANLFLLLRLWLGRLLPAIIGALTLAVSHTFWRHCCIAETYNLYIALFLAEQIMLVQYFRTKRVSWLYALGGISGLAISVHMLASIPFVCYAVLLIFLLAKKQLRISNILVIVCLWLICASPYLYLIVKDFSSTGDLLATLSSAAFGTKYKDEVLNVSMSMKIVVENMAYIMLNFSTPNILLFFAGLYGLKKLSADRGYPVIALSLLLLFFLFAFRYTIVDRYSFFIPFYVIVSMLIGVGADTFLRQRTQGKWKVTVIALALMPIAAYAVAPSLAAKVYPSLGMRRQIPYRDPYKFFLRPWMTGENGPELFAKDALVNCQPNSIILADGTTVYALWYAQQVNGLRHDVKILSDHDSYNNPIDYPDEKSFADMIAASPVYVVSVVKGYCPAWLLENYEIVDSGVLYRVGEAKNK